MERYDVVIVGAGIAGISAGIYLKRSSPSFLLIERNAPGGKLNVIHRIDNYPGVPSVSGIELSLSLQKQLQELGGSISYGNVVEAKKDGEGFVLRFESGKEVGCRAIIAASGSNEKKLGVPGEKELFGRGISYCATCDGAFFRNKPVLVYGYKDFAAEDALYLASLCSKVYFLYPQEIEATEAHLNQLRSLSNVEMLEGRIDRFEGEGHLERVVLSDGRDIGVDGAFPLFEQQSGSAFLAPLGVEANNGFLKTDADMQTSVPNVYAAGDIVDKRLRQLVNAASEGAMAAVAAIANIRKKKV